MSEAWTTEAAAVKPENSPTDSIAPAKDPSDKSPTVRLVIRAHIIPDEDPPITAIQGSWNYRAIALAIGALVLLVLAGIGVFKIFSAAPPEKVKTQDVARPAPVPNAGTVSPATGAEPLSATKPAAPESATPDKSAALAAVNTVLPKVSQSSLQTIHGTIKVSVRVTVDQQGTVVAASPHDHGSSRYFERLALDASKQWTFSPATTDAKRIALLQFNFSRSGVTADVHPHS